MRTAGLLALLICLLAASSPASWAQEAPTTFAAVEAMAEKLASQPYNEPPSIEGDMRGLGYDQYRALRPRPDSALWREGKGLFRAEFFPAGFIYDKPVQIFVIDGGNATPVSLSTDQFDFSDVGLKALPQKLTPAGFRLRHPLNRPDKFDEVISFLGASYFRPIARGQIYGASARGLAIDTAVGKPEEFPRFRTFWLVKPADGAAEMTVWALLEFAQRDRRLLLHHPAGRAHPGRHQERAVHAQRHLAARHCAADLDVLRRQGLAGTR